MENITALIRLTPGIIKVLATIAGQLSLSNIEAKYGLSNTLNLPIVNPVMTRSG